MIIRFTIEAHRPITTSGRQGIRTLIPTCGNRLSRAARPTVSGYLPFQWTHRGSNPDLQTASLMSSLWTMSPSDSGPPGSRTPISWLQARRRPVGPAALAVRCAEVRPGIEPGLPPYHGGVLPKHLQTTTVEVIPRPPLRGGARSNHRSPGCHPGVFAVGPRDLVSDRSESRTHRITRLSTSPLFRLRTRQFWRACPNAPSCRSGSRTRQSKLMRLG